MARNYVDVVTPEGILVFPKLFTPEAFEGQGDPKYSCTMVFPKDTDLTALKQIVSAAFNEKFPRGATNARSPFCDGNEKVENWGKVFENSIYIRLNTKNKPAVVDSERNYLNEEEVYSGMRARAVVSAYAYDRTGNKGVALSFSAVQIVGAGEKLGFDSSMSVAKFGVVEGGFKVNDPFGQPQANTQSANNSPEWF